MWATVETSPWALTLTELVPEAFELPASDWPEKKFLANQQREAAGEFSCFLTRRSFPIDRHSCVARSMRKVSEQNVNNLEKLQALARLQGTLSNEFLGRIF